MMGRRYVLLRSQFEKTVTLMARYYFDTLSRIITVYVLFILTFFGGRAIAPGFVGDQLSSLITGFFLWTLAIGAYSSASSDITSEAQWGTLEQNFMSPFGLGWILIAKVVVNLTVSFFFGASVAVLMILTTGAHVQLHLPTIFVVSTITLLPVVGVGIAFGGITLIYKRISSVFSLVRYAFIGLLVAPISDFPVLKLFPLTIGSQMLLASAEDGATLLTYPPGDLGILVVKAVIYFVGGYLLFVRLQRYARSQGNMGHY
jgi:ABC-2 type transport system permease protein